MKKLLIAALVCAGILSAQDRVTRVITIKNGNLGAINRTLHEILSKNTEVLVSNDNEHLVLSGPKEQVAAFEEVVKQLDVPPAPEQNIQTVVYMIIASQAQPSGVMPAELDPVMTQLKALFSYKSYRLFDSLILRSRSGQGARASGFAPSGVVPGQSISYNATFDRATLDVVDKSRVVRFNHLDVAMRVPISNNKEGAAVNTQWTLANVGVTTDIDVPEGKKVVVGKTSSAEGPDSALILVISAKVVD